VRPLTGAPQVSGQTANWAGDRFRQRWSYDARTTYVLGEFYWQVRRDERARVTDYDGLGAASRKRLSREQTVAGGGSEVTWSLGETLEAGAVADAFGIPPGQRAALQRDAAPLAGSALGGSGNLNRVLIGIVLILILLALIGFCSQDDCRDVGQTFGTASAEYQQCLRNRSSGGVRSSGGSWGGWSSGGGGHK
jgi:hypothetical protein